MRKSVFLMGFAVLALSSCLDDQVTDINEGHQIDFRVSAQTRATETTTANLTEFVVTAIDAQDNNYFTDVAFVKDGEYFTSDPAYYWPGDGSTINFHAYAPAASVTGAVVSVSSTEKLIKDFSPKTDVASQVDLITAAASGNKNNETSGVELEFGHRLSQITINASNSNAAYVYKVKGYRIAGALSKGTLDLGNGNAWSYGADKATYEKTYDPEVELGDVAKSLMADAGSLMLIPQQLVEWDPSTDAKNAGANALIGLYMKVVTTGGAPVYPKDASSYAWVGVPISTNWEAGYKYIYNLDFSAGGGYVYPDPDDDDSGKPILGGAIKFKVNVLPWEDK